MGIKFLLACVALVAISARVYFVLKAQSEGTMLSRVVKRLSIRAAATICALILFLIMYIVSRFSQ
jgi:hypothetical protein